MREVDIDLGGGRPQKLTAELAQDAALLMGCRDACPFVPGLRAENWPLKEPKGSVQGLPTSS